MTTKRLQDEHDQSSDGKENKRLRKLPSFSTDIVMAESLKSFWLALEPVLRRVVQEEVERGLVHGTRLLQRSPQGQIQAVESSSLKLTFRKPPSLPIYTSSKIEDEEGSSLQIILMDTQNGEEPSPVQISSPIKVELVVIDGDFPGRREEWSADEFNDNIVIAREGKRPLLTGEDVNLVLRDYAIASIQDLMFTDNSSWTRSRNFRIGARVSPESYTGPRIKEAITKRFTVKDRRGESYMKRYPPRLGDEVWRLNKIGKDGAFHMKLSAANIHTVQDFLKLSVIDQSSLRMILGMVMSDKMWEATINHARTCELGEKLYLYRGPYFAVILNPICEVQGVVINDCIYKPEELIPQQRANVQIMAHEAYLNWDKVEEADSFFAGTTTTLIPSEAMTQGLVATSSSWFPGNQGITTASELQMGLDEVQLLEATFSLNAL